MRFATLFLLSLALLAPAPAKAQVVAMEDLSNPGSVWSFVQVRGNASDSNYNALASHDDVDYDASNFIADSGVVNTGSGDNSHDPWADFAEYEFGGLAISGTATSIANQGGANFSNIHEFAASHSSYSVGPWVYGLMELYMDSSCTRNMSITSPDEVFDAEDELPMVTEFYVMSGFSATGDSNGSYVQTFGTLSYYGGDLSATMDVNVGEISVSFTNSVESDYYTVPFDQEFDEVTVLFIHTGRVGDSVSLGALMSTQAYSSISENESVTASGMVNYGVITTIVP